MLRVLESKALRGGEGGPILQMGTQTRGWGSHPSVKVPPCAAHTSGRGLTALPRRLPRCPKRAEPATPLGPGQREGPACQPAPALTSPIPGKVLLDTPPLGPDPRSHLVPSPGVEPICKWYLPSLACPHGQPPLPAVLARPLCPRLTSWPPAGSQGALPPWGTLTLALPHPSLEAHRPDGREHSTNVTQATELVHPGMPGQTLWEPPHPTDPCSDHRAPWAGRPPPGPVFTPTAAAHAQVPRGPCPCFPTSRPPSLSAEMAVFPSCHHPAQTQAPPGGRGEERGAMPQGCTHE